MYLHDLALALIAFGSEALGTVSGFGSSTFFVPLSLLIESFYVVLALTGLLHLFGNLFRLIIFRSPFEWHLFVPLAVSSLIMTGVGALLTDYFSVLWMRKALGIVLVLVSVAHLFRISRFKSLPRWVAYCLTGLSGFATGFVGTGGAIRGIALTALQVSKTSFVRMSAGIDLGGDFVRTVIYLRQGFMDWNQWFYIPLLGLAAYLGSKVGQVLLNRINQGQFEKIVGIFMLLSGILMYFENE